jgi:hypothetical protein
VPNDKYKTYSIKLGSEIVNCAALYAGISGSEVRYCYYIKGSWLSLVPTGQYINID